MKTSRTFSQDARGPFAVALAELEPRIVNLRGQLTACVAKQIAFEKGKGVPLTSAKSEDLETDRQARALRMLNGSAARVPTPKKREGYAEVIEERATIERAFSIADQLGEELRLRARGELAEARLPDFQALMKQKAQALIGLERIEQAIDEVIKGTNLQNYPIPGLGRLSNTASRIYAFLEQIVRYGLLPRKDLDDEYKRARKAGNQ